MKRITKRLVSLLLMTAMLLPMSAIYAEDIQSSNVNNDILVQMGIIGEEFALSENTVTRAEFSEILCGILTWNDLDRIIPATKQIFSDVSQWDWIAGTLEFLTNRNIIFGYDDSTFRPDEPIDLCSAYSMVLNTLGYREFVRLNGDYPTAVMNAANITEINEGLSAYVYNKSITGKMATKLFENMIRTKMLEFSGATTGGNANFSTGKTFLNGYMSIYEYEGIITGAEGKSIIGNSVAENEVEIDGVSYDNATGNLSDILGLKVTYYLEQSDDGFTKKLWAVIPDKDNNVLDLDADLVYSYINSEVVYDKDGKRKTVEVSLTADILKNCETISRYYTYVPAYGRIKLIDNNDDKTYDVAIISDYETIIISSVDAERGIIYGKNSDLSGAVYQLNADDFDYFGISDANGNRLDISAVSENGVLTGEITANKYVSLIYSEQKLTGTVTNMEYDDFNTLRVTVEEMVYKVIDNVYAPKGNISINAVCDLLLDYNGNIAAVTSITGSLWHYGYLMFAGQSAENDSIELKMLTQDGKIEYFETSNDFKIDSVKVVDEDAAISSLRTKQLVRYRMKRGQISAVDTATNQRADDYTRTATADNYNSLLKRVDAKVHYRTNVSIFKRLNENVTIDGEIPVSADTIIFSIPQNPDTALESDYKVIKKSEITNGKECRVESFNTAGDELRAEAVLMYEDETTIALEARLFIVEKVSQVLNSDNEVTYKLSGYYAGNQTDRILENANLLNVVVSGGTHTIVPGDILRTKQDSKGRTTAVELMYSADSKGKLNRNPLYGSQGTSFSSILRCLLGKVTNKTDEAFALSYGTTRKTTELFPVSGFTVYVCDVEGTDVEVYIGTVGDIPSVAAGAESAEDVIVCTSQVSPRDIIIIK